MKILQVAVIAGVLAATTTAGAVVDLRLDFGNKAAPPTPTPNWNTFSAPTTTDTPVVDFSTGSTSHGITVTFVKVGSTLSNGTTSANWNMTFPGPDWLDADKLAAKDFMTSAWNTSVTITFKNLDPTLAYTLEAVASTSGTGNNVPWRVRNGGVWSGWTTFNARTNGYDQGQWLTWNDVAVDANNQVALQIGNTGSTNYNILFNAVRLYAVPEPATLVMLALGGLLALRRRSA